ncbi:MAG: hypothetical protein Q7S93_08115 [Phenylobacterium sp.]|uniref:hypothetical protein n=1 Tax=Phenylobacterium sp. TaxID=1871053 RepID=UPI00271A6BCE|nr:hypothetical protein [Phenylobacterium sp.]MDO8410011.1 hypothetical protein [Phenylobacterium sp.]
MAITRKEEARALSGDEQELVGRTHHPEIQETSDEDLRDLIRLVRERRNKARDMAHQRRREMRGKGEARGATPSAKDDGSKAKLAVLSTALRRANVEAERRRKMAARVEMTQNAQRALQMKREAKDAAAPNSRHAHQGMRKAASQRREDLMRPMERGRQRKAGAVAQARRDAR